MEVTLKYFAWVRERIGTGEERVTLPEPVSTVRDAILWLKRRGEGYAAAFEREDVIRAAIARCVRNRLLPTITGG